MGGLLPTPLSLSLLRPLLPDGKNQLLLALLKCTGEGSEGAASACGGEAALAGVILTSAQGRLFRWPVVTFPWSLGLAQGKSNIVAPRTCQNCTSSSCVWGQVSGPWSQELGLLLSPGPGGSG